MILRILFFTTGFISQTRLTLMMFALTLLDLVYKCMVSQIKLAGVSEAHCTLCCLKKLSQETDMFTGIRKLANTLNSIILFHENGVKNARVFFLLF